MSDPNTQGSYTELVARISRLEATIQLADLSATATGRGTSSGDPDAPEVTVSHDQLADGTWRYKTSVTLKPQSTEALAATLAWADGVARDEAERREQLDTASGRIFSKPRMPKNVAGSAPIS
jgi:hypothetical protein